MAVAPDPEVIEKASRRRYTAKYQLQVLAEAARCEPGEIDALLRREGRYSSHLTTWRRQREAGVLAALTPRQRGRRGQMIEAQALGWRSWSARSSGCASACSRPRPSSRSKQSLAVAGERPEPVGERRPALMAVAETLGNAVGMARACQTLGVARATLYRQRARRHRSNSPPRNATTP